jgi:hypothetical protein
MDARTMDAPFGDNQGVMGRGAVPGGSGSTQQIRIKVEDTGID